MLLVLTSCAGLGPFAAERATVDADAPATPPADTATGAAPASPTASTQNAVGDLSDFTCTPSVDGTDLWTATGTLTNSGPAPVDYQVTVAVVDASGGASTANARTVALADGDSTDIDMGRVRGPADGTCQVQVLRLP